MVSETIKTLFLLSPPFGIAVLWSFLTTSLKLKWWLRRSVIFGAPALIVLILVITAITANCTHQANFGFTACQSLPVGFANASMSGFVVVLMLLADYALALFGVGLAIEIQTRFSPKR